MGGERWHVCDEGAEAGEAEAGETEAGETVTGETVTGQQAAEVIARRGTRGLGETWLADTRGRLLCVIGNGSRAMVMLLDDVEDPGEHAVDPDAEGEQGGYVLKNGQHDTYPDRDTVPLPEALRIVGHIVDRGCPPAGAAWQVDR